MRSTRILAVALIATLSAGSLAHAQSGGAAANPAPQKAEAKGVTAVVTDEYDVKVTVAELEIFEAAGGILGGGKPKVIKELLVWQGAHELLLEPSRIKTIEVGAAEKDRVKVRVVLVDGKAVDGEVDRELELHGKVDVGQYRIKISRVKRLELRR